MEIAGRHVTLTGHQPWTTSVEAGWTKVDEDRPFPTFTTSRPRTTRGHRPAGLDSCDGSTITRWEEDLHRFPPYQYIPRNCLVSKRGEYRLPNIREREYMMGLPVGYTQMCMPKYMRKHVDYHDKRLTLVGNAWAVPVVAWPIGQLVGPRVAGGDSLEAHLGGKSLYTVSTDAPTSSNRATGQHGSGEGSGTTVGTSGLHQGIRFDDYSGAGRNAELPAAATHHQCKDVALEGCLRLEMA